MDSNVKKFNKLLRKAIDFESIGFQDLEKDDFFYSWKLARKINDKMDVIGYNFSKDVYYDNLFLHPVRSFIVFEQVNKILLSVDNHSNFYLLDPTIVQYPNFDKNDTENCYSIAKLLFVKDRIVNEQIFEEALAMFQKQLETSALPFFNKIQTLQQVNDEILEKYEQREWTKYIIGETMFKSLIILKLCNNEVKYEQVSQSHKKIITNAIQEGHTQYQERYNTLLKLLNFLENGKHLEQNDA